MLIMVTSWTCLIRSEWDFSCPPSNIQVFCNKEEEEACNFQSYSAGDRLRSSKDQNQDQERKKQKKGFTKQKRIVLVYYIYYIVDYTQKWRIGTIDNTETSAFQHPFATVRYLSLQIQTPWIWA